MGIDEEQSEGQSGAPLRRPDQWLQPGQSQLPGPSQPSPTEPRPMPSQAPGWKPQPRPQRTVRPSPKAAGIGLLVIVLIAAGFSLFGRYLDDSTPAAGSRSTHSPLPELPEKATTISWQHDATDLRDDLPGAEYVGSISGDFDESYLAPVDGSWLAVTGEPSATQAMLHGFDPDTGDELWRRDFDGALCATEGQDGAALCASTLERDEQTGLGTRWLLHRLDPKSGTDQTTREVAGWIMALHLSGDTLVVLEQRRPAPHAVVSGYDATTLAKRWTIDLSDEDGHRDMFSTNRIIDRPDPKETEGPVLDRPRFSDVSKGMVAIYAGRRTAFIKASSGELVMMPPCTRPTDDGERLWCNMVFSAVAYSYRGKRLYDAEGVRLAAHDQDKRGKDIQRPVFINQDGELFSVDRTSGEVLGSYAEMGNTGTWAGTLNPSAVSVGEHTFVQGDDVLGLLDPKEDKLLWTSTRTTSTDLPFLHDDQVWFTDSGLTAVRLKDGVAEWQTEQLPGIFVEPVEGRVVATGMETIAVVEVG